jgi:thiol-disulfide isomerase/thioredoxin
LVQAVTARDVINMSQSMEARGLSLLALAEMLLTRARSDATKPDEREQLRREAKDALAEVVRSYPNFDGLRGKSGERATAILFELQHLALGSKVPELIGEDLDGVAFKLSDYRGKVVLLNFWAHWCGHCMEMVPRERALVRRFVGRPFALIEVNGDQVDNELQQKNKDREVNWRSFKNQPRVDSRAIADRWNIQGWPTLFLVDHKGIIRAKWSGSPDADRLDLEVEALVKEAETG